MAKHTNWLKWLDDNILGVLVTAFIFIAPLYPKIPFIRLEYTYVAIRLEDFYVVMMTVVYAIQLIRRKVSLDKKWVMLFGLFWAAVFASFLYGYFVQKTIPVQNIGFLHAARRIEYMIVFFIAFSSLRSAKQFYFYLSALFATYVIANIYAIGQKFIGWPAVQTMNPEFARGHLLYLTPEARVSSTFAGHYDLAAYLVLLMPILLAFYLGTRKLMWYAAFVLGIFVLVLTASRISFIAYLVSIFAMLIFMRRWKVLAVTLIITGLFFYSSKNLTSRIFQTFQIKQIFVNDKTGEITVPQKITSKELPAGSYVVPGANNISQSNEEKLKSENLLKQKVLDDFRKAASAEGRVLTSSEEANLVATATAGLTARSTVVSDISFATRLQVEWPRAWNAFLKNPVFGTGPSSITESSDNDILRSLGEVGALGTLLFAWILFEITRTIFFAMPKLQKQEQTLYWGYLFGLGALIINAGYIDVFEASKVAYTFWTLTGIFMAGLRYLKHSK